MALTGFINVCKTIIYIGCHRKVLIGFTIIFDHLKVCYIWKISVVAVTRRNNLLHYFAIHGDIYIYIRYIYIYCIYICIYIYMYYIIITHYAEWE